MKIKIRRFVLVGFLSLAALTLLLVTSSKNLAVQAATPGKVAQEVISRLQAAGVAQVIVQLRAPVTAAGSDELDAIAQLQASVLAALAPEDFDLHHQFRSLPAFAGRFTAAGIAALQADPFVASVTLDLPGGAHLAESTTALYANVVSNTYGLTGKGITVAVLDTGIDTTHVDLADAIVGQHCFTAGNCQPGNVNESSNAQDLNGHGTHVSGIVTSNGTQAWRGFAPSAEIVAVRVLDQSNSGWVSDWIAGLDWLNTHFSTLPVQIVNMSLGTFQLYNGNCDSEQPVMTTAVANLRAKGVVIFASSGNQGSSTAIASPACNSGVIAVGATYDSNVGRQPSSGTYASFFGASNCFDATTTLNTITCFTNSNSQLDILAPGAPIASTKLGGGTTTYYGTSQASPTAAGVAALMLEKDPSLTPDEIEALLKSSGTPITDPRNSLEIPRISAITAVNAVDFYNHVSPTSVVISGPTTGNVNTSYNFTATTAPVSTTLPITYSWKASDSATTYVFTDDISASVSFNWSQPGPKVITVTAENEYGSVVDTHAIEINQPNQKIPIGSLALTGPATGLVDNTYSFTATVAPVNASLPITYQWVAAGQTPINTSGDREESVSFTWAQPGIYPITVTATNPALQSVSKTMQIQIKSTTPQTLSVKGPASGMVGQSLIFLASVLPVETKTPVTFTWQATDQSKRVRVGTLNDSVNFTWQQAGIYTISVKAENVYGSVSTIRQITINAVDTVIPIEKVSLEGPESGLVSEMLYFTATTTPSDSSLPITYLWESPEQTPIEQVTNTTASIAFVWEKTGTFPITLTVSNAGGLSRVVKNVEIKKLGPQGIIIDGPDLIAVGEQVTYTATLIPSSTGLPVTYVWSATEQISMTHTSNTSDQISFQWDQTGPKLIQVEATNTVGNVSGEKLVEVVEAVQRVYLPVIER